MAAGGGLAEVPGFVQGYEEFQLFNVHRRSTRYSPPDSSAPGPQPASPMMVYASGSGYLNPWSVIHEYF